VRVAIRRLEDVEAVDVSLSRASADLRLRSGNRVTLARLRQIVKDNGFTARDARVTAIGTFAERDGRPVLVVSGTDMVWRITADPMMRDVYDDAVKRAGAGGAGQVEVVGQVNAAVPQGDEIAVHTVTPGPPR
jgi:hypothetical protein